MIAEILFEIVFQFVFELFANLFMEFGFRTVANLLRARITRLVIGAAAGFGFGLWWGGRLADRGHEGVPRLFVVSIVVAVVAGALAANRMRRDRDGRAPATDPRAVLVAPWRWDAARLTALALLNVAVAAGIDVGFNG